jgi:hypothetical protein
MEIQNEQIASEIIQAIIAQATARGLSVNDYLRQALGLNGLAHEEEVSLAGTPFEDVEEYLGVFDSREQYEKPEIGSDHFSREVIAKLERQGIKLP